MVGSSLERKLRKEGFNNIVTRTSSELDLILNRYQDIIIKYYLYGKYLQMPTLKLKDHLSLAELNKKLTTATDLRIFKQWQILNAVANNPGVNADIIASLLGSTPNIVRRYVRLYNKFGSDYLSHLQWGGRREARSNMSFLEEKDLLKNIAEKSLRGEILTARDIQEEVEKKVNRKVSQDYLWDLFKRHGWKKKTPRPRHPLQDIAAQDLFKKNSPMFWQPTL